MAIEMNSLFIPPRCTRSNFSDVPRRDAESARQDGGTYGCCANLHYLGSAKLRPAVPLAETLLRAGIWWRKDLPRSVRHAATFGHVSHVVEMGSKLQMRRVAARRIVAFVPNEKCPDFSDGEKISYPVREVVAPVEPHAAITARQTRPNPRPTLIGAIYFDVSPEACDGLFIHWTFLPVDLGRDDRHRRRHNSSSTPEAA
jgi:hypothetical protein